MQAIADEGPAYSYGAERAPPRASPCRQPFRRRTKNLRRRPKSN